MSNPVIPIDPSKIAARPWRVVETAFGDYRLESANGRDIVTQAACWRDDAQFICDVVNAAYAEEQRLARSVPGRHPRIGATNPREAQRAWEEMGFDGTPDQTEGMYEVLAVEGDIFTAKRRRDLEVGGD